MRLTPPTIPVFLIAVVIAVVALGDLYYHLPQAHHFIAAHRFAMMVAAFAILTAGVVFPGL
jgi:hypothetical protein